MVGHLAHVAHVPVAVIHLHGPRLVGKKRRNEVVVPVVRRVRAPVLGHEGVPVRRGVQVRDGIHVRLELPLSAFGDLEPVPFGVERNLAGIAAFGVRARVAALGALCGHVPVAMQDRSPGFVECTFGGEKQDLVFVAVGRTGFEPFTGIGDTIVPTGPSNISDESGKPVFWDPRLLQEIG